MALLEWFRAAELSCDRAATLVNRDPLVTCRTLMVIAGGAASRRLNLDAFIRQAAEYRDQESGWDRIARLRLELAPTHPIPVKRVHEVMKWVRSGEYDRIVDGEYLRRGEEPPARDDAGDAVDFYAERFKRFFKDAGAGVATAGDKFADAADKVSDWLRTSRSRAARNGGWAGAAGPANSRAPDPRRRRSTGEANEPPDRRVRRADRDPVQARAAPADARGELPPRTAIRLRCTRFQRRADAALERAARAARLGRGASSR